MHVFLLPFEKFPELEVLHTRRYILREDSLLDLILPVLPPMAKFS